MQKEMNNALPMHLAIILDGNRRWAKDNSKSVNEGHQAGIENLKTITKVVKELGIKYLTVYAFSIDNLKRSRLEVDYLFNAARHEFDELSKKTDMENNIRIIGEKNNLPADLVKIIDQVNSRPWIDDAFTLLIAFNYRSDYEIASACKKAIQNKEEIKPEVISKYLYTYPAPPVDLLIRTSGEQRLSGFLLYQMSYAELYFSDVYWPEFDEGELQKALQSYQMRQRRLGE